MQIRTVLLVAAAALAISAAPSGARAQTANPYLSAGMRLYADFEYESALEQLKKAAAFPGNAPAQDVQIAIYLGLIRFELGDPAGAEADFKTALALDPAVQPPGKVSPKVVAAFERAREVILKTRPKPVVTTAAGAQQTGMGTAGSATIPTPVATTPTVVTPPVQQPTQPQGTTAKPGSGSQEPPKVVTITAPRTSPRDAPVSSVGATTTTTTTAVPDAAVAARRPEDRPQVERPRSRGSSVLSVVLLGAGAALGGGGAYFGMQSSQSVDGARTERFQSTASGRLEDARSQALTANILYGAAGAAVVAGVISLFAGGGSNDAPAAVAQRDE